MSESPQTARRRHEYLPNRMFDPVANPFAVQNLLVKEEQTFALTPDERPEFAFESDPLISKDATGAFALDEVIELADLTGATAFASEANAESAFVAEPSPVTASEATAVQETDFIADAAMTAQSATDFTEQTEQGETVAAAQAQDNLAATTGDDADGAMPEETEAVAASSENIEDEPAVAEEATAVPPLEDTEEDDEIAAFVNSVADGLDEETQTILLARLAKKTRGNYIAMIVRLIHFLQDTYPDVLPDVLLHRLAMADQQDSKKRTKRGAPPKCRDASKSVIVDVLDAIDPRDESTFPIKFDEFSFNIFAAFLKTFKKTVTKRSRPSEDATTVVTTTMTIRLGAGSFSGACSALAFLFVECGIEKDATPNSKDLWRKISLYAGCS